MFERLSRSWTLMKASASVLRQDPQLVAFPLVSIAAMALVVAAFALPVFGLGLIDQISHDRRIATGWYAVAFLFYFSHYFIGFFFNAALVGAAMIRLEGGTPTLGDGLRIATAKIVPIAGYALIAATVGMILRAIQERVGFLGRIVVGLVGATWTIATFMVVPVLVAHDVGPVEAVKESCAVVRKTWGENLAGQGGIGLAFGLVTFGVLLTGIFAVVLAVMSQSPVLIGVTVGLVLLALSASVLVHAALSGIYSAALYRYATAGQDTAGFDTGLLESAFRQK
jgi:hypothetical protein